MVSMNATWLLWIGLAGIGVWLCDFTRLLGRLLGTVEAQATRAAYAAAAGVARAERALTGKPPSVWDLAAGLRLTVAPGVGGFGSGDEAAGELAVVGTRWVHQRVEGLKTAEWREFALVRGAEPCLLVALKFMNKLVLMRRIGAAEFAPGLAGEPEAEQFVLRHSRAGISFTGGPNAEPLTVGRVGPVRYSAEDWPDAHGGRGGSAESFLAGTSDKMHHLLARKQAGRLWLWYGRVVSESALTIVKATKGAGAVPGLP